MADPDENFRRADRTATIFEYLWDFVRARGHRPTGSSTVSVFVFAAGVVALFDSPELRDSVRTLWLLALLGQFLVSLAFAYLLRGIIARLTAFSPALSRYLFVGAALLMLLVGFGRRVLDARRAEANEARVQKVLEDRRRHAGNASHAERIAAQAEREARAALLQRLQRARHAGLDAWRQSLVTDHALGGRGVRPPMLEIQDDGHRAAVTNRAQGPVCVLLTRIASDETGALTRCAVAANRCQLIAAGETRWMPTLLAGNPKSCLAGELEFRVGNVDHPQPSWWSETAFRDFASADPDWNFVERWNDERVLAEAIRLEELVQDRQPPAR